MICSVAATFVLLLQVTAGEAPQGHDRVTSVDRSLVLSGRVTAVHDGRPLRRAVVRLASANLKKAMTTRTDRDGAFSFAGLPSGDYRVRASKAGYLAFEFGQTHPFRGGKAVFLRDRSLRIGLSLPRAASIAGAVEDPRGDPVDVMRITVYRVSFAAGRRQLKAIGDAMTGDSGEFRVGGLPPGEYYVMARDWSAAPGTTAAETLGIAPTFYAGSVDVRLARRVRLVEGQSVSGIYFPVVEESGAAISGTVRTVAGRPTAATVVLTDGPWGGTGGSLLARATTDARGRFRLPGVSRGEYQLVARAGDGSGARLVELAGSDVVEADITVGKGATILARVVSSDSRPLPFAPGRLRFGAVGDMDIPDLGRSESRVGTGWTVEWNGIVGRRWIRPLDLPEGWWVKSVSTGERDVTDSALDLTHGLVIDDLVIVLDNKPAVLAGTVGERFATGADRPTVIAFADSPQRWTAATRFIRAVQADPDGTFRIEGLPPEVYRVIAVVGPEPDQWFDPEYLESLRAAATRIALREGEHASVNLVR